MNLQDRIELLVKLGNYLHQNGVEWQAATEKASRNNAWFAPEFIKLAADNIASQFLQQEKLQRWAAHYQVPNQQPAPKTVGIVMAGNIPMVGFHDFLCVFIQGHKAKIKLSSKDEILIPHLVNLLEQWDNRLADYFTFADIIKGCDAYIATGSNNTGRYFEYYFSKYPHIIRRNRTSVAIIDGSESEQELALLAGDIQLYFGMGCRNITQLFVPQGYDFIPLLEALKAYDYVADNHKYKHNFDYHLALLIMNSKFYMNNGSVILAENVSPFSPVSQIHYQFYDNKAVIEEQLQTSSDIQCITGHGHIPFGSAQQPSLADYADGVDTMEFLAKLA
ncbi:hypothetical protein SAMN05421788_11286 [Filimonas lacunae]|uniref:Acyl-CoA reductase (LuxC) n=1 Tax=Filimonas lacunae TaxID=477680 RepID=A0A173MLK4_9BACT|nr:acyl-CoA reductase [Filimonas lacunae]BAV08278.1 hypothetical protein FLA_4314 [Filimonas lacunae]SIT33230.1 hypothetical protein SAMN05421788_11286 [Filimonas lacunae]